MATVKQLELRKKYVTMTVKSLTKKLAMAKARLKALEAGLKKAQSEEKKKAAAKPKAKKPAIKKASAKKAAAKKGGAKKKK